ncbi:putative flavonol 3-O-glucosyltransferase [Rosa chinensis]|uniref:Putative flavonol 3-O-glucosyltransferase n=1 Tax=Rosa chinensis TaxID=74649 RepID=A0A2P6PK37_ROSCH|nr:putative flavonol 3-O-glucosyltransferase [Rosa chinensis]
METKSGEQLNILFFPYMVQGHIIPLTHIAKLFSSRGVKSTIITTPVNAPFITKATQRSKSTLAFDQKIELVLIKFPSAEVGLPEECERADLITTPEMEGKFFTATRLLEPQLEQILDQHRPHCLVADFFFPWATDVAAKFGIPRLYFHATGLFPLCATLSVMIHQPHKNLLSETESILDDEAEFSKFWKAALECEKRSYGVIINSFYELEPDYADHYRKVYGRKTWHIGPVSLFDKAAENMAAAEQHQCFKWLDSKKPNSVVYVCFGSMINFADCQLLEIAAGLEASGQDFIWVVKKQKKEIEEWLPEGFEKRMQVGAFLSHCGWNSVLEGVSAGIPMMTWPVFADHFYTEKLVTQILRVGVGVGAEKWVSFVDESLKSEASVKRQAIEKAVTIESWRVMKQRK